MAVPKTSFHARSISLPSSSHPVDANIEDQLRRLSASQAGTSSSSSICQDLCSIKDLYEQMSDYIILPHNQTALSQMSESVLDGSLSLLDASSCALESISQMKESILELQSALRRGCISEGINAYLISRKKINKAVSKCLSDLKKAEKSQSSDDDCMLKQAEAAAFSTIKSVLSFVMGKKATQKWSLVSKLVKSKHCEAEIDSEVVKMDTVLRSLNEKHSDVETKALLKQTEALEMIICDFEDGLESASKYIVRARVSLLNVLSN